MSRDPKQEQKPEELTDEEAEQIAGGDGSDPSQWSGGTTPPPQDFPG